MSKELRARPPSRAPRRNGQDAPWPAGRFARAPARKFSRAGPCEKEKSLYLFTIARTGAARPARSKRRGGATFLAQLCDRGKDFFIFLVRNPLKSPDSKK